MQQVTLRRLAALEQQDGPGSIHVVRVGYRDEGGGIYFDESKEAALARHGINPLPTDTVIFITYARES